MKYTIRLVLFILLALSIFTPVHTGGVDLIGESCGTADPLQLCDPPFIVCSGNKCKHKTVFAMEQKEFFGFQCLFMVAMFAVASGIGGGALLVPILILLFELGPKEAIALSNGQIFFISATKYVLSIYEKHPNYLYKPQIDYNISIIFNPMIIFGAYIGVIINAILPNLVIQVLLICTILLAAWVSYVKGRDLWKKENIEFAKKKALEESTKNDAPKAIKTIQLDNDVPLDGNALYKIVNGKPVPIDKNEMATILELYQVAHIEISDEPIESEFQNEDLPVYRTGLAKSGMNKDGFNLVDTNDNGGNLNNVPKMNKVDQNKLRIGDHIGKEPETNNPLSERAVLRQSQKSGDLNYMMSSPEKNRNSNEEQDEKVVSVQNKEDKKDAFMRSNSGQRVDKHAIAKGKEQNDQQNLDGEQSMCMVVVGKPEDDPNQDGMQHQRWILRKKEATIIPPLKFALVWIAFTGTVIVQLFQGAKGFDSVIGIEKCEPMDWTVFGIYLVFIFTVAMIGTALVRKEEAEKEKANWAYYNKKEEPRWTLCRALVANAIAPAEGLAAAAVGLGGGVTLNPTLLAFGFQPVVVSATSMFLIMVSKLAASILYALSGKLIISYWIFGGFLLITATTIAQFQLKKFIKKFERQSIIAFIFVFFMAVSVLLVALVGGMNTKKDLDDKKDIWEFTSFCSKDD